MAWQATGRTEAADAVLVRGEHTQTIAFHRVPHVAVEIIVAGKQQPPAGRKPDRRDAHPANGGRPER